MAKALDASGAGEVVVSAAVWERLEAAGWCSDPVEDDLDGEPLGLRLIRGAPDASGKHPFRRLCVSVPRRRPGVSMMSGKSVCSGSFQARNEFSPLSTL